MLHEVSELEHVKTETHSRLRAVSAKVGLSGIHREEELEVIHIHEKTLWSLGHYIGG